MNDPNRDVRTIARRVLALMGAVISAAALAAVGLVRLLPAPAPRPDAPSLPPAFLLSTVALAMTSLFAERAVWQVRRERQSPFRRSLAAALASAVLFAGSQAWGLTWLRISPDPGDDAAGVNLFLFVFAALHAVHVSVGLVFLSYALVQARADRYDHEYYWGARCCAAYWHALGVVWLVILGTFSLQAAFLHG